MSQYDQSAYRTKRYRKRGWTTKEDRRWTRWCRYVSKYEPVRTYSANRYGWSFVPPQMRDEHRRQWKAMMP